MKICLQFLSDIHLENHKQEVNILNFLKPSATYLAILGDLGYPNHENYKEFLRQASALFEKVFLVSGNHEYYITQYKEFNTMDDVNKLIQEICTNFPNIFYLNNKEYILDDDIIILGTTLWSNIPEEYSAHVALMLNDYNYIYKNHNNEKLNIDTNDVTKLFNTNLEWLSENLNYYKNKKIIILSHHLPSFQLIHRMYVGNVINYGFASNLDYFMKEKNNIKYWLCGHTHFCMEAKINECFCITNPLGYRGSHNRNYNKEKIITINN